MDMVKTTEMEKELNGIDKTAVRIREKVKMFSHDVNVFGFRPMEYVDSMNERDFIAFTGVSEVFVSLMAKKEYTDDRNRTAKERCASYISDVDPSLAPLAEKKITPGTRLCEKYIENREWDIKALLHGRYASCSEAEVIALLMSLDHPTLQQTFTQACLYALMKKKGRYDLIQERYYSLPLI